MPISIQFDSTEIFDATHDVKNIKHESNPEREVTALDLARADGQIFITEKFGVKKITLSGILISSSQSNLELAIDTFKELFSRVEKNLDISWMNTTRRYVATCIRHEFDRDYFHLNFVPWTAEFIVLSGEGKNISSQYAVRATGPADDYNDLSFTTTSGEATGDFSLLGSKPPKPTITLKTAGTYSSIKGFAIENTDTGERIIGVTSGTFDNNDYLKIYFDEKKVVEYVNGVAEVEIDFFGVFPSLKIGTNNFKVYAGGIPFQENYIASPASAAEETLDDANDRIAQSFEVPYSNTTFKGISLILKKVGSPGDNITVEIQTDNGNKPSGSVVSNATWAIAPGDMTTDFAWVTKYSANLFTLSANTKYWIVIKRTNNDGTNYFVVGSGGNTYSKGVKAISTDGGTNYTLTEANDLYFRIRIGGEPQASTTKITILYYRTHL